MIINLIEITNDNVLKLFVFPLFLLFIISSVLAYKSNNNHLKIILLKFFLLIGLFLMIAFIILPYTKESVWFILYPFMISVVLVMALMWFGHIETNQLNIYELPYNNFQEFVKFLKEKLLQNNFEVILNDNDLMVYKKEEKNTVKIYINSSMNNLTDDMIESLYERAFEFFKDDFDKIKRNRFKKLMVTFIINTNKITPSFNKFVKNIDSDYRYFKLPVGISYGGNKLYISNSLDGFDMPNQSRMFKEFMNLMDIKIKRK